MLINEGRVEGMLARLVSSLACESSLREDLLQEARIHLWRLESDRPGQTPSWYLQGCRFRLQHWLTTGRSLDSRKRRNVQVLVEADNEGSSERFEQLQGNNHAFDETSVRDLKFTISLSLKPRERAVLDCLADGLPTVDIARKLGLSSPTVTKYRRKIAKLAVKLGIAAPATASGRLAVCSN